MVEHTPGPWVVMSDDQVITGSEDNYGEHVADCSDILVDPAQSAANARLIAAAPSMKAALEGLVYAITHLSPEAEDGSHTCRISRHDLVLARDALALVAGAAS